MKFSRNTTSGQMEAYTDDGVFVGHVVTMGDLITRKNNATDGGPGSGNFGHKGRPGLVGGSGPGGGYGSGKMYRHEKEGVGFFGTRKDWLNGLEGEKQHKAARFLSQKKKDMKEAFAKAEEIKNLYLKGYLTLNEYEEKEKELGVNGLNEKSPVEEFIIKQGKVRDVDEFIDSLEEARNWGEHKDKYLIQNLNKEERKVFNYLDNSNQVDKTFLELKAKAMGINVEPEISDDLLIKSGVKEAPKPKGANYDWYEKKRGRNYSMVECSMGNVIGQSMYGERWSGARANDFAELNRIFLKHIKYERLSPMKCREALKAMEQMRSIQGLEYDEKHGFWHDFGVNFTNEHWDRLNDDEKKRLLEIANKFIAKNDFDKLEDVKDEDFYEAEQRMSRMDLKTKEDQAIVREYVELMDKMLTGEAPTSENPVELRKKMAEEEKKRKEAERAKRQKDFETTRDHQQLEFEGSPSFTRKKEAIKTVRDTSPEQIMKMTRSEVKQFMTGVTREDGRIFFDDRVPDEFYMASAMAFRDVIAKYPFLAGEIGGFGDHHGDALAGCSIFAGYANNKGEKKTEILFDHNWFSNLENVEKTRIQKEKEKWWSQTGDHPAGYADICHELGHSLANWLDRYTSCDGFVKEVVDKGFWQREAHLDTAISPMLKKNVLKKFGIKTTDYDKIVDEVSKYGASSYKNKGADQATNSSSAEEFFAECFAELMCNPNPRRVAVEFGKQLDKFIKDHNITENLTATTESTRPKITMKRS